MIKPEDVPDIRGQRYPKRVSVSVTTEAHHNLKIFKEKVGKDPSELVRMLIDEFFERYHFEEAK